MLDQNTDRMWYVIGAIVIGAAIIAMGLNIFSESFNSVDEMMSSLTGIASDNVTSIGKSGIYTNSDIDNLINNEGYVPVATADELDGIRKNDTRLFGVGSKWEGEYSSGLNAKYIQVSNIDLSTIDNWVPIGDDVNPFTGIYDGGYYDILNLNVDREHVDNVGLFGYIRGSNLNNIVLKSIDVFGYEAVGGLVGFNNKSAISNSYISGVVRGDTRVGGLVGRNWYGSEIIGSQNHGDVYGLGSGFYVGGLVGSNSSESLVDSSFNTGKVVGISRVGGLVGTNFNHSIIRDSYNLGDVEGVINYIGGLTGNNQRSSRLDNTFSVGSVVGDGFIGGLVGRNWSMDGYGIGIIENSYYNLEVLNNDNILNEGLGKSTAEMQKQFTYDGWDFDTIWQIQEGQYPTLR